MRYRAFKRVIGETSLERKCRLLFGSCLALLITGSFWAVDRIAETLVMKATRNNARHLVDTMLLRSHFYYWETREDYKQLVEKMATDIQKNQTYHHEILALESNNELLAYLKPTRVEPGSPEEEILLRLKAAKEGVDQRRAQARQQAATALGGRDATDGKSSAGNAPTAASGGGEANGQNKEKAGGPVLPAEALKAAEVLAELDRTPVYEERRLPGDDEYQYFEPIYWSSSCEICHLIDLADAGAVPHSQGSALKGRAKPFLAVKVVIPYDETKSSINDARAILIAVAILTVFAAMIALYVIIRYVVVKPLKHLRDVSDDVSRGKTEVRATIQTNDEFEELGASFNRMLRHMTDAQVELRQVNVDLDGKVDQLAQLNMRLYEMNRLKGDFLANMSHELRTPLNSIIGFSEVLQGIESLTDKQKRYAQNIQKSGRLLLEMINDILDLAKMEAGKMEVRPSEFVLDIIVNAQCDMVRSLTEEKNIDLEVQVQPEVPPMFQDQAKVQQILTNLLSNAIKFTPEGGRITVSANRNANGDMVMTVADTGVGIAEEDREIIFEKFRQAPTTMGQDNLTREYSGTGLGLSILKELCKLLDGEISFESTLGVGSTFQVVLPWVARDRSKLDSELARRLDELEHVQRDQARRAQDPPGEPNDAETTFATQQDL